MLVVSPCGWRHSPCISNRYVRPRTPLWKQLKQIGAIFRITYRYEHCWNLTISAIAQSHKHLDDAIYFGNTDQTRDISKDRLRSECRWIARADLKEDYSLPTFIPQLLFTWHSRKPLRCNLYLSGWPPCSRFIARVALPSRLAVGRYYRRQFR